MGFSCGVFLCRVVEHRVTLLVIGHLVIHRFLGPATLEVEETTRRASANQFLAVVNGQKVVVSLHPQFFFWRVSAHKPSRGFVVGLTYDVPELHHDFIDVVMRKQGPLAADTGNGLGALISELVHNELHRLRVAMNAPFP